MNNPHIVRKTTSPTSAPPETGIHWINTATNEEFFSIGTVSVSDWIRRGLSSSADSLVTTAYNQTGATIPAFSVVYINGAQGSLPTITLAQANSETTSSKTYGITATSVTNNNQVTIVSMGLLANVNTSGFVDGDALWLSPSVAGGVTTTKPTAPNHAVFIGFVTRSHPTLGRVEVKVQNGYELNELHNVLINGVANRQPLVYDSATSLWKNSSLTKSDVGLNNVDNTSDASKPVSTATQSAIDGKQDLISGGASTITTTDLTPSKVLVSDISGKVAVSPANATSLAFLDATSSIQTQLDAKALESQVIKKDGSVSFTANQSMGNHRITDVTDPSNAQDVATKSFVENLVSGLDWKQAVHAASIGNVNIASAPASIDSHTLDPLQRVLLKDQSTPSQNGIYVFNGAGNALTRSSDADTWDELVGAVVYVEQGTTNQGAKFNATIVSGGTLGVTPVTFTVFSTASSLTGVGTTGYNAYWNGSANISSEQYVNQSRGGFGTDTTAFNGYVKATSGVFTASTLTSGDVSNSSSVTGASVTNALNTLDTGKVSKSGDTMTAGLTINSAGNSNYLYSGGSQLNTTNPANYAGYFNNSFGVTNGENFTDGTATYFSLGNDNALTGAYSRVVLYNDKIKMFYNDGITTMPILPTANDEVVVKKYVDDTFLPLAGGTLTDNLIFQTGIFTEKSTHNRFGITHENTVDPNTYSSLTTNEITFNTVVGLDAKSVTATAYNIQVQNDTDASGIFRTTVEPARIRIYNAVSGIGTIPTTPIDPEEVTTKFYTDATFAKLSGATFTGSVSATNLSGTNTGDETATTIKTKLGASSASNDGYLSQTDWSTFNNKEPLHFIPALDGTETFRGYLTQNNSTTITAQNIAAIAANGTATARAVASTNMQTKQVRAAYAVSTPAANGLCGLRATQLLWSIGSGFKFHTTFAYTDSAYNAGALQYYGLHSVAGGQNISTTISVSSLTNIIAIGSDSGDTALSIFHNDATGTATKITLNATDFPANRTAGAASTDIFSIEFYNALGSSEVKYRVVNLTTQVTAQGTLTTDLPLSSQLLTFQLVRTSGLSSNACSMDFTKAGIWSIN